MLCALVLDSENRIMDFIPASGAPEKYPKVDETTLPKGEVHNYKYVGGEYVYDPLPKPEPTPAEPSVESDMQEMIVDHEYRLTLLELGS